MCGVCGAGDSRGPSAGGRLVESWKASKESGGAGSGGAYLRKGPGVNGKDNRGEAGPRITLTIHEHGVDVLAVDSDGIGTWAGFYRWNVYGLEMPGRVLPGVEDWIIENAPAWVAQWDAAGVQA